MRAERAVFWGLIALIVWAPFPLGSNRGWAWAILVVASFALLAVWLTLWACGKARVAPPLRRAWPALTCFGIWTAIMGLTVLPLPSEWVAQLSPESARVQDLLKAIGVKRDLATLSVEPYATHVSLVKTAAYVAIFFLFLAVVNSRSRVTASARVLLGAAVLHAIYALLRHVWRVPDEHFGTVILHGANASGFYPNQNHFAGMLEMSLAIGVGLLWHGMAERKATTWRRLIRHAIEWLLSPRMVLRVSLGVMVVALAATHSRMGNGAFMAALALASILALVQRRPGSRRLVLLLASLIVVDLIIVGSFFGAEKLAARLESTSVQDLEDRYAVARHSLGIIKDYPLFGSGAGTFYTTFPRYRTEEIRNFYDYTHNDYVQVISESGLIAAGFLGMTVLLSLAAAVRGYWVRRDPLFQGISLASIMGIVALMIHSWVDFNLQIPANAVLFMVLLAYGWIGLFLDRAPRPVENIAEIPANG